MAMDVNLWLKDLFRNKSVEYKTIIGVVKDAGRVVDSIYYQNKDSGDGLISIDIIPDSPDHTIGQLDDIAKAVYAALNGLKDVSDGSTVFDNLYVYDMREDMIVRESGCPVGIPISEYGENRSSFMVEMPGYSIPRVFGYIHDHDYEVNREMIEVEVNIFPDRDFYNLTDGKGYGTRPGQNWVKVPQMYLEGRQKGKAAAHVLREFDELSGKKGDSVIEDYLANR